MIFWDKNRSLKTKIMRGFFPFLKLQEKNLTWYYKLYIYVDTLFMLWILLFICFYIAFMMTTHTYSIGNIEIHTNLHLKQNKLQVLNEEISSFCLENKINTKNIDLFLTNSNLVYNLLLFPGTQLYLSDSDGSTLESLITMKYSKIDKKFTEILEHELVHVWQFSHFSFYRTLLFEHWVKEGYPTYKVGLKSFFVDTKEKHDFIHWYVNEIGIDNFDNLTKESYAFSALMVKHAIEKMHKSVDDLHLGKVDYDEVLDSMLREYNISKTPSP